MGIVIFMVVVALVVIIVIASSKHSNSKGGNLPSKVKEGVTTVTIPSPNPNEGGHTDDVVKGKINVIEKKISQLNKDLLEIEKQATKAKDASEAKSIANKAVQKVNTISMTLKRVEDDLIKIKQNGFNDEVINQLDELEKKVDSSELERDILDAKESAKKAIALKNAQDSRKPYTIQAIPFLPNVQSELSYKKIQVKYSIQDSIEESFPIIRAPQKGCYIKYPITARSNNRGATEQFFCNRIVENGMESHFYDNLSLFVKNLSVPYEPDLAYIDEAKGIFLDVEIDEPYVGWERTPIHYKVGPKKTIDDLRNQHFTERGWTVIRFSEKQIREQTMSCLKSIFNLLNKMDRTISIPMALSYVPDLKSENWWTKELAERMEEENKREKLLGISKFIEPTNTPRSALKDYEGGKFIEDKIIEFKDDSCWKKCLEKGKFEDYKSSFPRGRHIQEVKQKEDDQLWARCKREKKYTHYIYKSETKKYESEARTLQQEKDRTEKQERENLRKEQERLRQEEQRLERERQAQENRRREAERIAQEERRKEEFRRMQEAQQREQERLRQEEQRLERERQAQEKRRLEEEQRRREAQEYERRQVSTQKPPTTTPSSRGYA